MSQKKKFFFITIICVLICVLLFLVIIKKDTTLNDIKSLVSSENRQIIKKYVFPYKYINQKNIEISQIKSKLITEDQVIAKLELNFKDSQKNIQIKKKNIKLSNQMILEKYQLVDGFYAGINILFPGSGYIDFHEDNLLILSSRGIIAYTNSLNEEKNLKQISNNINEYINLEQFKKNRWFSLKDMFIFKNKIFISFTEEIEEGCWNTSVLMADMNYENIDFKKLFSPKECVHQLNNIDKQFNAHQSGGRIISFGNNHILLSIGDFRSRHLAQDKKSVNGKLIKININNLDYKIISMGHRNPQGLYFDKENNYLLETEHGPSGGDEINLIEINKDKIPNFGWAIVSAGEHYGGRFFDTGKERNTENYLKYPLYKSHSEHGFIEPLKSFVPSIGISEIVKIDKDKYVASSLQDKSLFLFEINEQKKIYNLKSVTIGERIRDLKVHKDKLYLFLENTASIGVINLNY